MEQLKIIAHRAPLRALLLKIVFRTHTSRGWDYAIDGFTYDGSMVFGKGFVLSFSASFPFPRDGD